MNVTRDTLTLPLVVRPAYKQDRGDLGLHDPFRDPCFSLKGGSPSARSRTDTLLRLSPNQLFCLKPRWAGISGTPTFHDLTGGEYKTQEHIQCAVADTHLLAIPASWGRVAALNPNLDRF